MFFCKKSFKVHSPNRGFSLIELLISSTIVGIVVSTIFGLIAAQTRQMNANKKSGDTQIQIRELSALLIRDLDTVSSGSERAPEFISFEDGGIDKADRLTVFRLDDAFFSAPLGVQAVNASQQELTILPKDPTAASPVCMFDTSQAKVLERSVVHLRGEKRSGFFIISAANSATCTIRLAGNENIKFLETYNNIHNLAVSSLQQLLTKADVESLGKVQSVELGFSTEYWIKADTENGSIGTLMRSINGLPEEKVLDGVIDLQIEIAHDLGTDPDGLIASDEWDQTGNLVGATTQNFNAVKIGFTLASISHDELIVTLPEGLGNRKYTNLSGGVVLHSNASLGKRYRYKSSFVVVASRR